MRSVNVGAETQDKDLERAAEEVKRFLRCYVTRTRCRGKGADRAVILGVSMKSGRWCQVVKVWAEDYGTAYSVAEGILKN